MAAQYQESQVPPQDGKTVFITGANTGIGFDTARVLAEKGARVLLGCRDGPRAKAAMAAIRQRAPKANLKWIELDLTSLASVQSASEQVLAEDHLDLLINNAGVMVPPKTLTQDGFELQFGVNHLGHFALTGQLLPLLKQQPGARVVTVSSFCLLHTSPSPTRLGMILYAVLSLKTTSYTLPFSSHSCFIAPVCIFLTHIYSPLYTF